MGAGRIDGGPIARRFSLMAELKHFYNAGFGWICKACERELSSAAPPELKHSRAFREGEAESKNPTLANEALARWTDSTRRSLICPRCEATEDTFID